MTIEFQGNLSTVIDAPPPLDATAHHATGPLSKELLDRMHRYWSAANYLTVGQIYLQENPLLREPLRPEHIKQRLLGHWGTSSGLNFILTHLNRVISERNADVVCIIGPGHGGPAGNAHAWLEGTYSEIYHSITQDETGMRILFRQFSTPGGVSSHCGAHLPGSIHEGGELGYSLLHAYGAAFDNPELIVACIVGDGEAETGPLEGSWKGNKFLNPVRDGAVLPILHLNGYKISGPTVYARIPEDELISLFHGHGHAPFLVSGDDPTEVHQQFAAALDKSYDQIHKIQREARGRGFTRRPIWPMIILRTPKGWTGPKMVDGVPIEGTFRAHQVPLATVRENPKHLRLLEEWMRSYKPEELFDRRGQLVPDLAKLAPRGDCRISANPHVNGGRLLTDLELPNVADYSLDIPGPGQVSAEAPIR